MGKKKKQYKLKKTDSFSDSDRNYFNRELSLIKFSSRLLCEAENPKVPLMERVNFLAICASNIDEFFSVRVPPYQKSNKAINEFLELDKEANQLDVIYFRVIYLMRWMSHIWHSDLLPELKKNGITFENWSDLSSTEKEKLLKLLENQKFNIIRASKETAITRVEYDNGLAFVVYYKNGISIIPIQSAIDSIGRIIPVGKNGKSFIFIEDVLVNYIEKFFIGEEIYVVTPIRLTRDKDIDLQGEDAEDLYEALMKTKIELPHRQPSRLETEESIPYGYLAKTGPMFMLSSELIYDYKQPLGMAEINQFKVNDSSLYYPSFTSKVAEGLEEKDIFDSIAKKDRLQFTPYQSFDGMINFVNAAAADSNVTEISMTLYRLGSKSPIVDALIAAAKRGANVTAVIELKASFDEERNFKWKEDLKNGGVRVISGPIELKTHGKCCLVTRREGRKTVRYGTISTGNYNAKNANAYTDFSLFTADKRITDDLVKLFKMLDDEGTEGEFKHLLISPNYMESGILSNIKKEIQIHKEGGMGYISMKMNSLTDKKIIDALYAASEAGVKIDLFVRGVCMLRPGVPNLSSNIKVYSTVGRYLEHARVYFFSNKGDPTVFIGSADMMPRNLRRRVEILCPVYDSKLKDLIFKILRIYKENKGGQYQLDSIGHYTIPSADEKRAQDVLMEMYSKNKL